MPAVIAKVRLANGQLGFVDELSGVYLNWMKPEQEIYAGTNCANLRRGIKARRIILTAGSLGRTPTFKEILHKIKPPEPDPIYNTEDNKKPGRKKKAEPKPVVEQTAPVIEEPAPTEEFKEEIPVVEETAPVVEEIKIEEEIPVSVDPEPAEVETIIQEEEVPAEEPVETPKKKRKKKG